MKSTKLPSNVTERPLLRAVYLRLKPYRMRLMSALLLLFISVPLINFHPMVWGFVADALLEQTLTVQTLSFWLILMVGGYIIGLVASGLHSYLLEKTGQAFVRDIRVELFQKFEQQSIPYHREHSTGDLVTRMTSDVDAMEQSVLQGLTALLEELMTFIFVAGVVVWISPLVWLASILPLALAFIFIKKYNLKLKAVYQGIRTQLGHMGSFVQDRLAGVFVSQSYGREAYELTHFKKNADRFYQASVQASRLRNTFFPMVSLLGFINNGIMLGLGGWLILNESPYFSLGALLAYRGFWWRLQSPIRTIAQTSDILQRARAAASRIVELLEAPVAIVDAPGAVDVKAGGGQIEFKGVHFAYDSSKPILKGVDLKIAAGEFVAVAGSSGAGKSTLLNLIPRFYAADQGRICLDGVNIEQCRLASLRSEIAYVGQEHYLFDTTIRENLLYANPHAHEDQLLEAARQANAHTFIQSLPQGYATRVGQNGVKLSGGQRQRLSLARAFLMPTKILLLDEPTASVEPESEALIHQALLERSHTHGGTTVMVTHRVDLLEQAPRILFMDEGRVAGDGSHAFLLQSCAAYREAYHHWQHEATLT
ncbi:MAG: ABC transporter ATP-binding protein [Opitutales bacterium]